MILSLKQRGIVVTARSEDGISLIEVIGVLAILTLMVAIAAPVAIRRLDAAARDAEKTNLAAISEAYVRSSLSTRQFPTLTAMPQQIAGYLNVHTNKVRANRRGLNRVYLSHPNFSLNGGGLQYVQTTQGVTNSPLSANARLLVVSSLSVALPTINPSNFDNIWNTPEKSVPSSLSTWTGRGEDLIVERIELAPRFYKVVLLNLEPLSAAARYSIDSHPMTNAASGTRVAGYFLEGTVVSFYRSASTNGTNFVLDFPETIQSDVSFVYQNGRWGRNLSVSDRDEGTFGQLVDLFLQQPVPCDPDSGATQRSVVDAFYDYLWGYADWGFGNPTAVPPVPPFSGANTSSSPQYPAYSVVQSAQGHLSGAQQSFADNLFK